MNQANQKAVVQNANMNLIYIRNMEIKYFSQFFTNFGTQSAILIGCTIACISQVSIKAALIVWLFNSSLDAIRFQFGMLT